MTQVAEVMTRGARFMSPQDTLQHAAQIMSDLNVGAIPVCEDDRVVGMLTDRDIVVRAVAQNLPVDRTPLSDVMSSDDLQYCYDDDPIEEVSEKMEMAQIRRLPVVDHEQHLVGIVSLGDVATKADSDEATQTLAEISEPSQPDRSPVDE